MNLNDIKELYKKKHDILLSCFANCDTPERVYEKIIEIGKNLPNPLENIEYEANLVHGCQSIVYLSSSLNAKGNIFYQIQSDALISSGLAHLLLLMYQDEKIELTLFCPPLFIQDLGLPSALSISRSNGLASMYARMQQDAKKLFIQMHAHL